MEAVLFLVILVVVLIAISRSRHVRFDREHRVPRLGWQTPIPFADLEVRVFRYRQEEDRRILSRIMGELWSGMAAGTEELHQVYVVTADRRIDLKQFRSKKKAAQYADEIRQMIAGS